ncbi:MAG TPA: antitoxin Xre-like helix-turn-helix domain-containing protein [Chitinophagaceae bacterium]|nr:antitoxin Xre-like helix-turn-helix domain-containing protein [Chitinophagaceae bacterium]
MSAIRKKFASLELKDELSIVYAARKGVLPRIFYSFAEIIKVSEKNLAALLHMHPRTISNYKEQQKHLNPVESEHLLKLIYLYANGEEIFGSIDEFNQWLEKPRWNNQETPMDWLNTPGGVDLVSEEVNRLAHGYVA